MAILSDQMMDPLAPALFQGGLMGQPPTQMNAVLDPMAMQQAPMMPVDTMNLSLMEPSAMEPVAPMAPAAPPVQAPPQQEAPSGMGAGLGGRLSGLASSLAPILLEAGGSPRLAGHFERLRQERERALDPAGAGTQTRLIQEYNLAKEQGYPGTLMDFERDRAMVGVNAKSERDALEHQRALEIIDARNAGRVSRGGGVSRRRSGGGGRTRRDRTTIRNINGEPHFVNMDTGEVRPLVGGADGGGIARRERPIMTTEGERASAGFFNRMFNAEGALSDLNNPTFVDQMAGRFGDIGNFLMSPEGQMYRNLTDEWIRAKLRKESGAVIGEQEMAREYQTYFPQVGDSPEVIRQKGRLRQTAMSSMRAEANRALELPGYRDLFGDGDDGAGDDDLYLDDMDDMDTGDGMDRTPIAPPEAETVSPQMEIIPEQQATTSQLSADMPDDEFQSAFASQSAEIERMLQELQ